VIATSPAVVAFGDVCLHVTVRPGGPEDFTTGDVVLSPGGSCAMVARQVAALGRPVVMVGVAGSDDLAAGLRAQLTEEGIDCSDWANVPGATARVAILVGAGGEHRVVVEQGGVTEPGEALAGSAATRQLSPQTLCYVPGFPAYDPTRRQLLARGARLVCDLGFRPWLTDLGSVRRNVVPRAQGAEVAVCSGAEFTDAENTAVATECLAVGAKSVVTSLGPRGCLVTDARGTVHVPGLPTHPVDTLGAGDSLVAGLIVALGDGNDVRDACAFAQAVAAAKVAVFAGPARPADVQNLFQPQDGR
jgi:sugar/nucleoside kinase (ribokinase family)